MEAVPSFFIEHLLPVMSMDFLKENIQFLNDIKKVENFTVRFNDLYEDVPRHVLFEKILVSLKNEGLKPIQDQEISEIFHIPIKQKNIVIQNRGDLPLQLFNITSHDSHFVVHVDSVEIEGGNSYQLKVMFSPTDTLEVQSNLELRTNDPNNNVFYICIQCFCNNLCHNRIRTCSNVCSSYIKVERSVFIHFH